MDPSPDPSRVKLSNPLSDGTTNLLLDLMEVLGALNLLDGLGLVGNLLDAPVKLDTPTLLGILDELDLVNKDD